MSHVLTMAIGVADDIRMNSHVVSIFTGDEFFVPMGYTGSGRKNNTGYFEIGEIFAAKAHYLIEAAKEQGGPDNVTVLLIRVL